MKPVRTSFIWRRDKQIRLEANGANLRIVNTRSGTRRSSNASASAVPALFNNFYKTFVKRRYTPVEAGTRGTHPDGRFDCANTRLDFNMPGDRITVPYSMPVDFRWSEAGAQEMVFEENGIQVFAKGVSGTFKITISPQEAGLKQGHIYQWYLKGIEPLKRRTLTVLDTKIEKVLVDGLKRLKKSDGSMNALMQSTYYQAFSEAVPGVDLYWASIQTLPPHLTGSEEECNLYENLIARYMDYRRVMENK
jgi:hypothetical protein